MTWDHVFKTGFAPQISTAGLRALREALATDDATLIAGGIVSPSGWPHTSSIPVDGACPIGFCGWKDEDCATVQEVCDYFGAMCLSVNARLGLGACRYFLNFVDKTPRADMRAALLPVVDAVLAEREGAAG